MLELSFFQVSCISIGQKIVEEDFRILGSLLTLEG